MRPETSLYPFQDQAIDHLVTNRYSLVSLPVGLGKTLVSLSMFSIVMDKYPHCKCLFLTKKSVVVQVSREVDKFFQGISCVTVYNDEASVRRQKYEEFWSSKNVLVTAYETIRNDWESFHKYLGNDPLFVVLDEATVVKNTTSKIYKIIKYLCTNAGRVVALSGTPVMNRLSDMFNILKVIGFDQINDYHFNKLFCEWTSQKIWKKPKPNMKAVQVSVPVLSGYKNVSAFYEKVKDVLFSKKKSEITALPPFQLRVYDLDHNKPMNDAIARAYAANGVSTPYGVVQIAVSCPPVLGVDGDSAKTEWLLEMMEEFDREEKVIIYSPFKKPLQYLESVLPFDRSEICRIYGDIVDRQAEVDKFADKGRVMLMTDAGGMGVSLQMANHIIFYNLPIQAGTYIQIAGRISRLNTKFNSLNLLVPLVSNSIDTDLWRILQNQLVLMEKVVPDSIEVGIRDENLVVNEIQRLEDTDRWIREKIQQRYQHLIKNKKAAS